MLTLRLKKKSDGSSALTFLRADGSTTWQRQLAAHAAFFPYHDLTHYVVESELGLREAFCGLVAAGWDFEDFGAPWRRGQLPADGLFAEALVGILDTDRAMALHVGGPASAEGVNAQLAEFYRSRDLPLPALVVSEEALGRIRARLRALFAEWDALAPGDALEVVFG
jgi:hypothetical protein